MLNTIVTRSQIQRNNDTMASKAYTMMLTLLTIFIIPTKGRTTVPYCADRFPTYQTASGNLTSKYPQPSGGTYGWVEDTGHQRGSVNIENGCLEPLYVWSVGARRMGGPREENSVGGLSTPCDEQRVTLEPGASFQDPYRTVCYKGNNSLQYCPNEDKMANQGVSITISRSPELASDILQFEYELVQEPDFNYQRFKYDVSLLDCGRVQNTTSQISNGNNGNRQGCSAYNDGLSVTFDGHGSSLCPWITCNPGEGCRSNDKSWPQEPGLVCDQELRGNVTLRFCGGNRSNDTK